MPPRRLGREAAVGPTESLESRRLMSAETAFTLVDATTGTEVMGLVTVRTYVWAFCHPGN